VGLLKMIEKVAASPVVAAMEAAAFCCFRGCMLTKGLQFSKLDGIQHEVDIY